VTGRAREIYFEALRLFLLLGLTGAAGSTLGAQSLLQDVIYEDEGDFVSLQVRFGTPMIAGEFEQGDGRSLTVRLTAEEGASQSSWSSSTLQFAEADRLLEDVSLEGDSRRGYALTLTFTEAIAAVPLPQFNQQQVLIKLSRRRAFNRSIQFSTHPEPTDPYTIHLESRTPVVPSLSDIPRNYAQSHTIYLATDSKLGEHELRLGFFANSRSAERALRALKRQFPNARVVQASEKEIEFAQAFRINPPEQIALLNRGEVATDSAEEDVQLSVQLVTPTSIVSEPEVATTPDPAQWKRRTPLRAPDPTAMELRFQEAQAALGAEDYTQAITLFTSLVAEADEPIRGRSLEMLGVTREYNGQIAYAKRYYESYLAEYPNGEGVTRVDQRLAALIALQGMPDKTSREVVQQGSASWESGVHFSQFYQRHELKVDERSSVPIDGLFNDLHMRSHRDGADLDQEVRITLSYLADFTDNQRINGREFQVSSVYWEGMSQKLRSDIRIGRQSRWDSGALGRFDGAAYTFHATDKIAASMTGGFLIDSSFDAPNTDRPFFALSGEYLSDSGNLSVKPFYIQQHADGVLDRQAIGLHTQFYTERAMFFSLIDYDLHYGALNNFTLMSDLKLGRSRLTASFEHRKNPYLTTRNALMGQPFEDLSALEEAILDVTLEDLADDRTATSNMFRLAWNTNLNKHWAVSADVVSTDFSRTESSADVIGLESHKSLYTSFQLRSLEPFGGGSYSALMVRLWDAQSSTTTSVFWDNRFSFGTHWRLLPRFRVDQQSFERNGDKQLSLRPSLRLDFRVNRRLGLEFETGYRWTRRDLGQRELNINGLFVRAGYRANF